MTSAQLGGLGHRHTHTRDAEVGCTHHISSYLGRAEYIPKMHW